MTHTLPMRPSDEYLLRLGIDPRDLGRLDPIALAGYAWREQADLWIRTHAAPVQPSEDQVADWGEVCRRGMQGDDPVGARWWWETHGLILYGLGDDALWRPLETPPGYVLAAIASPPPPPTAEPEVRRSPPVREFGPATRGIVAAMQASGVRWQPSADGPLYTWYAENTAVSTTLQVPPGVALTPDVQTELWDMARRLNDADVDVLLTALAHAFEGRARQPDGSVWLSADSLLNYRERVPRTRRGADGGYQMEGHRTEDRAAIAASMNRIDHLYVTVARKGARRRALALERKVLVVMGRIVQEQMLGDDPLPLAWQYRVGDWIDPDQTEPALSGLLSTAVRYDPYRQLWEKRLARFIVLYGCVDGRQERHLTLSVATLLDEAQLSGFGDENHPIETRRRLERALDQLRCDGVIVDDVAPDGTTVAPAWEYTPEGREILASLPRYSWLPHWRRAPIRLTLPLAVKPKPIAITMPRKRGRPPKNLQSPLLPGS